MTNSSPPIARNGVARAHGDGETAGDLDEHCVAHVVSELVVDGLEVVEVDVGHHQRTRVRSSRDME